jgi:chaperonin cofactor prefoldin
MEIPTTTQDLRAELEALDNQIDYLEDKQGFAPKALKQEFRALKAEIEKREFSEIYFKDVLPQLNKLFGL